MFGLRGCRMGFILQHLEAGDELLLETADGSVKRYRVERWEILHEDDGSVLDRAAGDVLTLLTCYPFGSVVPTKKRYVVRAVWLSP